MNVLSSLQPAGVFKYFEEMEQIPRGSSNTKAVSDWCVEFAKQHNLEHYQDDANNVIIIKEATAGYENAPAVIIQGHLDMVAEKTADCTKDMTKEGLDLFIDGDLIGAKGTTLGGDDGIAVAMAMAILADDTIKHPRIEAVFTVDEEIGMLGAAVIDVSMLKGRTMLNVDSEQEGILTVSCAGGNVTQIVLPAKREANNNAVLEVKISGLVGGHSGIEIDKGRANASILLGRTLYAIDSACDMRIVSVNGGLKDNAIPCEATAVITADKAAATKAAAELEAYFKTEYAAVEKNISVTVKDASADMQPMTKECTQKTLCLLVCTPNGIQEMSHDIEGLVQTSLNLGILQTTDAAVEASYCVRSSIDSQKDMLTIRLRMLAAALGADVNVAGDYSGWAYLAESPLRDTMVKVYKEQYGEEPKVEAVHAGVECGLFAGKLPGLDAVSFGPNLTDIHTPRERMSISSVQRVWKYVLAILESMK